MKKISLHLTLFAIAGCLLIPASLQAHHGWAAFDPDSSVTLSGTVADFHFVNPHCVVEFDVKDDKGQTEKWEGELTSAVRLKPKGWTATTLEAGAEVSITGYRSRNGSKVVRITKIVSNGKDLTIEMGN